MVDRLSTDREGETGLAAIGAKDGLPADEPAGDKPARDRPAGDKPTGERLQKVLAGAASVAAGPASS